MVLLNGIRHAGSFAGSHNALASTSLRLLVMWSNLLQFGQSSHWLFHEVGLFISWMSIMPFFTARCLKLSSVLSPLVSKTPLIRIMYVVSTALFMDSSKPPRAWYNRFASHLLQLGFIEAKTDTSLFVYHKGADMAYLLMYVDDIVLTASSLPTIRRIISALQQEFPMKDLGRLHFIGMHVQHSTSGIYLSQHQYMIEILERAGISDCKPCTTPVDVNPKLPSDIAPVLDPTDYCSLAGDLQYLTFTRPDIAYAVQQVCLHMHDPREPHLAALKRILRYIRGTLLLGLFVRPTSQTELIVYSDADWVGCLYTRRSTSGYAVFFGDNLVSWSSKRQNTVSRSSAKAEYRAVANAVAEATWLRQLLTELHAPLPKTTLVYCDNNSSVYMSSNPVQHQRTKHVEIDIHFVREHVALGNVRVLHVPTTSQYADIFTKGLPSSVFTDFRSSLNVRSTDVSTARGC